MTLLAVASAALVIARLELANGHPPSGPGSESPPVDPVWWSLRLVMVVYGPCCNAVTALGRGCYRRDRTPTTELAIGPIMSLGPGPTKGAGEAQTPARDRGGGAARPGRTAQ